MSNTSDDDIPNSFKCPITLQIMNDPVIDHEGNSYERLAVLAWLQQHGTSPITRQPLRERDLTTNRALRDLIEAYLKTSSPSAPLQSQTPAIAPLLVEYDDSLEVSGTLISNGGVSGDDLLYFEIKPSESSVPTRVDIVACIDISGSMGDRATIPGGETTQLTILDIVKHAVKSVIKSLSVFDNLGIVAFSDDSSVVLNLTPMDKAGQDLAFEKLDALVPTNSTNIWAGLDKSIDLLLKKNSVKSRNLTSILLLTDGVPNINPPRGLISTLQLRKEKTGLPDMINTFGFGYNLDSPLLKDIATIGNGSYSFIPDPGFVGTIFVHSIANILTTCAVSCQLEISKFTSSANAEFVFPTKTIGDVTFVNLEKLQIGQTKSFTLPGSISNDTAVSLKVTMRNGETLVYPCNIERRESSEIHSKILECSARMLFVSHITKLFNLDATSQEYGARGAEAARLCDLIKTLFSDTVPITQNTSSLLTDLTGQVVEAFRPDYFKKWGRHYLPSLLYAHM